jgi:toxin ParE1/3/4
MRNVRIRRAARRELVDAVAWYRTIDVELARDLVQRVRAAIRRAAETPGIGSPVLLPAELADMEVRRFALERFRYAIFALIREEELIILAIAHERRRPGFWLRRLAGEREPSR